jgi:hypothetical protein
VPLGAAILTPSLAATSRRADWHEQCTREVRLRKKNCSHYRDKKNGIKENSEKDEASGAQNAGEIQERNEP